MKFLLALLFVFLTFTASANRQVLVSGGPEGGTFNPIAKGIADYTSEKTGDTYEHSTSGGSIDNLQKVNNRSTDIGITYSGDLYLGRNGFLNKKRSRQYRNVYAVAYLYGAPAHLVVLKDSGINTVADLSFGKKVAVGNLGSGAATASRRFFESMGVWNKIEPQYLGYSDGADALVKGLVDALWLFTGFPNAAVISVTERKDIRLIPLYEEAMKNGVLFEDFPFYSKVTIPAGTYKGVGKDIVTFQDSTLLTAGRHVRDNIVEDVLNHVYTEEGLEFLVNRKSTARAMSLESGLTGIVTPLHKGAVTFWKSKGKVLTDEQLSYP